MAKNPSGVKEGKIQESNDRLDGNRGEILLGKLQMEQNSPKPRESKQRERERESSITQRRDFAALPPNSHEQPNTRRRIFVTWLVCEDANLLPHFLDFITRGELAQ
jgi:hypothetical protein